MTGLVYQFCYYSPLLTHTHTHTLQTDCVYMDKYPDYEVYPGFDHIGDMAFTWNTEKPGYSCPRIHDKYWYAGY